MLGLVAVLAVGCANTEEAVVTPEVQPETEEVVAEVVEVPIKLYFSNVSANGLTEKEISLPELTADNIIDALAGVNVVSYDTKVKSFVQDGPHLVLDLSKDFEHYLGMMGTEGEYLVLGGLVNTFLDAYEAEDILVTVEGKTLETGHASYESAMTYFEIEEGEVGEHHDPESTVAVSYRLGEGSVTNDHDQIYYPQFMDMEDTALQDTWNKAIEDIATGAAEGSTFEEIGYESCKVDYIIASISTDRVSFLLKREVLVSGGHLTNDACGLTFDLVQRKVVRLSDYDEETLSEVADVLANGTYKVSNDAGMGSSLEPEILDEYMTSLECSADDYRESFASYDYDIEDFSVIPEATSYVSANNTLMIVMDVPTPMGSIVVLDTGVEVK